MCFGENIFIHFSFAIASLCILIGFLHSNNMITLKESREILEKSMREMRKGMEVMDQEMLKMKNNMEEIAKSHENIMKELEEYKRECKEFPTNYNNMLKLSIYSLRDSSESLLNESKALVNATTHNLTSQLSSYKFTTDKIKEAKQIYNIWRENILNSKFIINEKTLEMKEAMKYLHESYLLGQQIIEEAYHTTIKDIDSNQIPNLRPLSLLENKIQCKLMSILPTKYLGIRLATGQTEIINLHNLHPLIPQFLITLRASRYSSHKLSQLPNGNIALPHDTGIVLHSFEDGGKEVGRIAAPGSRPFLSLGEHDLVIGLRNGKIIVYSLLSLGFYELNGHADMVITLLYQGENNYIWSGGVEEILVWNLNTKKVVNKIIRKNYGGIIALKTMQDGRILVLGERGYIEIFHPDRTSLYRNKTSKIYSTAEVIGLDIFLGREDGGIEFWREEKGKWEIKEIIGVHNNRVNDMHYVGNGLLATASADKTVKLVNIKTLKVQASYLARSTVTAISPVKLNLND